MVEVRAMLMSVCFVVLVLIMIMNDLLFVSVSPVLLFHSILPFFFRDGDDCERSIEQLYQKKTPIEHILLRPDSVGVYQRLLLVCACCGCVVCRLFRAAFKMWINVFSAFLHVFPYFVSAASSFV